MAYPQEIMAGAITRNSNAFDTADVLTAAAAVYGSYSAHAPFAVSGFSFVVSTAISDLTASVVRLTKVSAANVTTAISSLTIPNGTAVKKVIGKQFAPVVVSTGEFLQMEHLTQGGLGGTPAGAGFYGFLAQLDPEVYANETNYTTSA